MSYLTIDSNEIIRTIDSTLAKHGACATKRATGTSKNHWLHYTLQDVAFIDASGSRCLGRISFRNSYDKSCAFFVALGCYRAVCDNGLVWGNAEFSQRILHRAGPKAEGFLDQLPQMIDDGVSRLVSGELQLESERLQSIPVGLDAGLDAIASLSIAEKVKRVAFSYWTDPRRPEDEAKTLWSLLNVTNEAMRHTQGGTLSYENANARLAENLELLTTGTVAA